MITIIILMSLAIISIFAAFASSSIFDKRDFGPVSNTIELNRDTPEAVLANEVCKGNLSRDAYEIFVAEKYSPKLI